MDTGRARGILRKIGSWPITHCVTRKLLAVKWLRRHKVPEVEQRIEAISAAAPPARSTLMDVDALPPGTIQIVQIHAMLQKIETGNATASEIEEFRRLAGEVLRNWRRQYPSDLKKRIESAESHRMAVIHGNFRSRKARPIMGPRISAGMAR